MQQTSSDSHLFEKRRQNACVFPAPPRSLAYCPILCQKIRHIFQRRTAGKGLTYGNKYVTIRLQVLSKEGFIVASENIPLSYKGHPLRRKDNLIYYGTMAEKYIIMLQILATQKVDDMDVATKVSVQLQLTDPDLKSRDRVVKKSEKDSLYAAMDVASVWLERALSGK